MLLQKVGSCVTGVGAVCAAAERGSCVTGIGAVEAATDVTVLGVAPGHDLISETFLCT